MTIKQRNMYINNHDDLLTHQTSWERSHDYGVLHFEASESLGDEPYLLTKAKAYSNHKHRKGNIFDSEDIDRNSGISTRERRAQVIVQYAKCHLNLRHSLVRTLTLEDLPHHDAERKHVRFFRILAVAKHLGSVTQSRKCLFKIYIQFKLRTPSIAQCKSCQSVWICDLTREGRNRKS
ncbi:hypothetical protein PsorP6_008061 [Peronosclerospora sorghi]|uniref:Uncharacterized protein n=1 Tax=Peronosclerospora sorghi TaxID=230839 RepID=A0ACC0W9V4_9STRA|nr:hypothetical protein PsorP6_008061 [Peronosclerospora sorghi]